MLPLAGWLPHRGSGVVKYLAEGQRLGTREMHERTRALLDLLREELGRRGRATSISRFAERGGYRGDLRPSCLLGR